MIICRICNKELKKISGKHLKLHNMEYIDYVKQNMNDFPNWNICKICGNITKYIRTCSRECDIKFRKSLIGDKAYRYGAKLTQKTKDKIRNKAIKRCSDTNYIKMISDATKKAVNISEVKEKFITMMKNRRNDLEYINKMSTSMKKAHLEGKWNHCYESEERNKKISVRRKKWIEENRNILIAGLKKGLFNYKKNSPNKFEQNLYDMLKSENIKYVPQYEVDNKFYDAYIPEYNTLIEFDGNFWHKNTLKECVYPIQIQNFKNDIHKNEIAINNGYKILRIKESECISSIKNLLLNIKKEYI